MRRDQRVHLMNTELYANEEYLKYTNGDYLKNVYDWHESDSPWKAQQIFTMIKKHRLNPKSIYDVGCGAGEILIELQKNITSCEDFTGYDISPDAISIAEKKQNEITKFKNEDYLESSDSNPELTLLLDVFEHVSDYRGFLAKLRQKSNYVIFHIPLDISALGTARKSNHMLSMYEDYGHLHFFTKETALMTLSDLGYEIIDHFYTDDMDVGGSKGAKGIRRKLSYWRRKLMFRINPELTTSLFSQFNLLVLARGDIKA